MANPTKLKIFVSQPMHGLSGEQIESVYQQAVNDIRTRTKPEQQVEILSTRKYELPYELRKGRNERMCYWSHALQVLSMADAIYMCPGWQNSNECTIELNAARMGGLLILGPEGAFQ